MFDQIIYTSCCKGRTLRNGEPSGKMGGLQVYSFSRELLDRFPRVQSDEIEHMIATRCLWHPSCEARAYAYSFLSDGSALFNCNRESKPIPDGTVRSYHFSQGYIGDFDEPAAFNMGSANWLTDEDIRSTEGMSDVVYGMAHHFDCSDAPQADFLPQAERLPVHGNLRVHLQNLQGVLDPDACTDRLLACVHWLVEHANDDRVLLIVVPAKHDGIASFEGEDTRLPENVTEAQNVCESIMWIISYLLPAAAAVKLPFTVGMQYSWLKQNAGRYRISVTADEPNESMKQLLAQGKVDVLNWDNTDAKWTSAVSCPVYDRWIVEALNGNPKPLIGFKGFCEHLSGLCVSPLLFTLAEIYQAQCSGQFDRIPDTTLKSWLDLLERTDEFDWYPDLRRTLVTTVYRDYGGILDADMQKGYPALREMISVSERYDDILYDVYCPPILDRMEAMLQDTERDNTDAFVRMLQLKDAAPGVFAVLQNCLVKRVQACVDSPLEAGSSDSADRQERLDAILCRQSWAGMIGKLDFIECMMKKQRFTVDSEERMVIYESALYGAAVHQGQLAELYRRYSTDPKAVIRLLERFERRCEPPASGVKLLYQALVEMTAAVQSGSDPAVFMAVRMKYPEGIECLVNAWMKKDLQGTLRMCADQLTDAELSGLFKCLMGYNRPDVTMAVIHAMLRNSPQTAQMVNDQLILYAQHASLRRVDTDLIGYYREFCKAVSELRRIRKIELMELVQVFEKNSGDPDVLRREIYAWKGVYHRHIPPMKDRAFSASIDIRYFDQCENEFSELIRCLQGIVSDVITAQCGKASRNGFLSGKNRAKEETVCGLIDLCVTLFADPSMERTAGSQGANERCVMLLQEEWLSKIPEIAWRSSSESGFQLMAHLAGQRDEMDDLPASLRMNIGVVRKNLIDMLSSADMISEEDWKWIMNQVKRTRDDACREFFVRLDTMRKEKKDGLPLGRHNPPAAGAKRRAQQEKETPAETGEDKSEGIKSIFGKLFGDKKNGK